MSTRLTLEELQARKQRQQDRLKRTDRLIEKLTKAEEAKLRKEIVDAVKEWWEVAPKDKRPKFEELPAYFKEQAEIRRKNNTTSTSISAAVIDSVLDD